jgi:MmyB-like transcription regulator ligand binding domain
VQRILDAMIGAPAYARNGRGDILATNRLGHALYSEMFASPRRPVNTAWFTFLDPCAPDFFVEWDRMANLVVAARIERSRPSAAWKCQPMTKG